MKTILCFGDSNTWGAVPGEERRYGIDERWPALVRKALPEGYELIEEGQPGRTTVHDDPFEGEKNGLRYLRPCLESHLPDLVVILLGTNDLKYRYHLSAFDIAHGAARLVQEVLSFENWTKSETPQVLLVSPPPIYEVGDLTHMFAGGEAKSQQLARFYEERAKELSCTFFDAGSVIESCPKEGVHWQVAEHRKLAEALVPQITALFPH